MSLIPYLNLGIVSSRISPLSAPVAILFLMLSDELFFSCELFYLGTFLYFNAVEPKEMLIRKSERERATLRCGFLEFWRVYKMETPVLSFKLFFKIHTSFLLLLVEHTIVSYTCRVWLHSRAMGHSLTFSSPSVRNE